MHPPNTSFDDLLNFSVQRRHKGIVTHHLPGTTTDLDVFPQESTPTDLDVFPQESTPTDLDVFPQEFTEDHTESPELVTSVSGGNLTWNKVVYFNHLEVHMCFSLYKGSSRFFC
ncbi:hypothetical protein GEMRC1_008573 [Eukaryota sp. GEM-RC1]